MQSYGAMTLLQAKKKQREDSFLQVLLPLLNHFIIERKIFKKVVGGGGGVWGEGERQMQTVRKTTVSQYRERLRLRVS